MFYCNNYENLHEYLKNKYIQNIHTYMKYNDSDTAKSQSAFLTT